MTAYLYYKGFLVRNESSSGSVATVQMVNGTVDMAVLVLQEATGAQLKTEDDSAALPPCPSPWEKGLCAPPPGCAWVKASATSPSVRDIRTGHYTCAPAKASSPPRLLLFMSGTNPQDYTDVVHAAAAAGLHAISPEWYNGPGAGSVCAERLRAKDPHMISAAVADCTSLVQQMRLFGLGNAPPNAVGYGTSGRDSPLTPPNSIVGRSEALLATLAKAAPAWGQFLTPNGTLRWPRVVAAGHSRGASYPAQLQKLYPISRGVMFGGAGDSIGNVTNLSDSSAFFPAPWIREPPKVSPPSELYGLVPGYPGGCCELGSPCWKALNMSGKVAFSNATVALPAAGVATALAGARQLFDTELCLNSDSPHMCLIADRWAPRNPAGRNMLIPIWRHLFTSTAPPTARSLATATNCSMAVPNASRWPPPERVSALNNALHALKADDDEGRVRTVGLAATPRTSLPSRLTVLARSFLGCTLQSSSCLLKGPLAFLSNFHAVFLC